MWTMYAKNYQGYCIEYDFTDEVNNSNFLDCCYKLFPVIYKSERKFNVIEFLTAIVMNAFLEEKAQKHNHPIILKEFMLILLTKGKEWKFQEEWRLIGDSDTELPVPKIKAIYLGSKVDENNKNKMLAYARKYDFKIYLQENDYQTLY